MRLNASVSLRSRLARACSRACGRNRLPTWSARNGGAERSAIASPSIARTMAAGTQRYKHPDVGSGSVSVFDPSHDCVGEPLFRSRRRYVRFARVGDEYEVWAQAGGEERGAVSLDREAGTFLRAI